MRKFDCDRELLFCELYYIEGFQISEKFKDYREDAFLECRRLKSVLHPSSVENVVEHAFEKCGHLTDCLLSAHMKSFLVALF
jgi:hypothetical protein